MACADLQVRGTLSTSVTMSEISDVAYDTQVRAEMAAWRERVLKPAGPFDKATRNLQDRINNLIPEKVHGVITVAMEQMTRAILTLSLIHISEPTRPY